MKIKDWFRVKNYCHIGLPLKLKDRPRVEQYVQNQNKIKDHSFLPFIHRKTTTRKYRRIILPDGTRSLLRTPGSKDREIFYANHFDSNIFSYYAHLLSKDYEQKLQALQIHDCVTAYRRIPLDSSNPMSRNKCNVDSANDVFTLISSSKRNSIAITFDIQKFFDTLDHKILKNAWKSVVTNFTDDHYNIFRNITKFSYIEEPALFNFYKNNILVERKPNRIIQKPIDKISYLKNKRAVAYCEKKDIHTIRQKGLIKSNKYEYDKQKNTVIGMRQKGIPQGSPISSILANIYLIDFDQRAQSYISNIGGTYRRYSDDMVILCEAKDMHNAIQFFTLEIQKFNLQIQPSKTQIFEFRYDLTTDRHYCFEYNQNTSTYSSNTKFEYLGFQFDGKYTYLKSASLASYYRKMKRAVRRRRFYSKFNHTNTKGEIFKGKLYKKFTHLGANRRRIYKRDPKDKGKFIITNRFDWGNYITYAKMAARTIKNNKISHQIRNHWRIFHELIS